MTINPVMTTIRAKKLGLLIRAARQACDYSVHECAQLIGVPVETLEAYEFGAQSPSLPELEIMAYSLNVPLNYFWGNNLLTREAAHHKLNPDQIKRLRMRMIGAMIRKSRQDLGLTIEETAEKTAITVEKLSAYELGEEPVPIPELEVIAVVCQQSIEKFYDQSGPVGQWSAKQQVLHDINELPVDLRTFISKPVNYPYIQLAVRLSEMSVEKLRAVAEGLLEITL
jgi:transcriptional regulator with XRE-family HTH domain